MTRTAREHSPAKARLLDAAQALMLSKGFAATSVEEVCRRAKLTKGCFVHYFASKDALGKALLERFCASGATLHGSLCGQERDPLKRVLGYIEGLIRLSQDPVMGKGCLLGTFAQELCDDYPEIRKVCASGFDEWAEQFGSELARAKARYAPRASFRPNEVAEHLIAVMEGALILAKTKRDPKVVTRHLRHFRAYVEALFARGGR